MTFVTEEVRPAGLPIRVSSLVKRYLPEERGERPVLDGVSLSVKAGEWVILMGDSGSGKSTLLNLLAGVDRPDSGTIEIGNIPISGLPESERTFLRRARMGFVFQFFNLFPTLTVWENIVLPLRLNGRRDSDPARRLLEEVELAGKEHRYPSELSGGEQQRVALARALVHGPSIILADEPTGSLDHRTGHVVLTLLSKLHQERRPTIVMATHSQDASRYGQRILHIRDGEILDNPAGRP
jgi:putative ABC transport system ATP-binding protein